jgi:CheY-like chemotaxis protein
MIEKAFPGSDILLAESGSEALRICREQSPQVILMDVQMPGMSGYETTEELRKMQLEPSPIIIACTAGTVKGEKERCLQAGMNDYLSKPIVLDQLKDVLERWIIAKKEESFTLQQPSDTETVTFDQAAFANSFGNNEELMKAIMAEFVRQLDDFEQDLQTHTASGQHTLLKSTCHKIRGSAGATQMKKLARLTLTLEANPDQSTGQVQQQVSEILRELDVVRDEATKFLVKN